jgi:hypothetical protein
MARGGSQSPLDDLTRRRRLNQGCCPIHGNLMYVHASDNDAVLDVRCRMMRCPEKMSIGPDDKRHGLFTAPSRRPGVA